MFSHGSSRKGDDQYFLGASDSPEIWPCGCLRALEMSLSPRNVQCVAHHSARTEGLRGAEQWASMLLSRTTAWGCLEVLSDLGGQWMHTRGA